MLAIKSSGADVIGSYFTFENDQAIFARQARQLGVTIPWVGSPTTVAAGATLKLAGPAVWGTYAIADYATDSSPEAKEFGKLYSAVSNAPPDLQSAWPYDAIGVLAIGIDKAGSTDPGRIREEMLDDQGLQGR